MLNNKSGIIMGVANGKSLAAGIAKSLASHGAKLGFSHLPDSGDKSRNSSRVKEFAATVNSDLIYPCDVTNPESIATFFDHMGTSLKEIDFLVHSIAFAPVEDIRNPVFMASKSGFLQAMEVSVYSLIETTRAALPFLKPGAAICALTYLGGERVIPGYNLMGICKSALDSTVKYLAAELGEKDIRVNAVSAGPVKTLAASAVKDFKSMLDHQKERAPTRRNIDQHDVGEAVSFLLSPVAKSVTGEIMHVDGGFNILGA